MRTCPDCQSPVGEQTTYCNNCGLLLTDVSSQPLTAEKNAGSRPLSADSAPASVTGTSAMEDTAAGTCSACGFANVPGEMFCQNCGVQLAPVASSPPPPPVPISGPHKEEPKQAVPGKDGDVTCTSCGHVNPASEQYCQMCGFQFSEQQEAVPLQRQESQPVLEAVTDTSPAPAKELPSEPVPAEAANKKKKKPSDDQLATGNLDFVPSKLVVQATKAELKIPIGKPEIKLGRTDPVRDIYPEIDLSGHGGETSGVSRLHARLVIQGPYTYLEDLNSTNFTFLNRQRLQPGQLYLVQDGDEIRLGLLVMHYQRA